MDPRLMKRTPGCAWPIVIVIVKSDGCTYDVDVDVEGLAALCSGKYSFFYLCAPNRTRLG